MGLGAGEMATVGRLTLADCCSPLAFMCPNFGFSDAFSGIHRGRFTKNYALACFDRTENAQESGRPMTISVANIAEDASPMRGLLWLWVGVAIYALFLLAGNGLLSDPATMGHIAGRQWILDHTAVPETDGHAVT